MRSAKYLKASSILSMAIAATLGAKAAHAATVSLYYDNIQDITDGQTYNYATVGGNYAALPTTINIGVGDTFQFGIDAVLTNNVNPVAGKVTGTSGHDTAQPTYLGLTTLAIAVPSSDHSASTLQPITVGPPQNTFSSGPDYNSTASLNNAAGIGTIVGPNNNPTGAAPTWSVGLVGDINPESSTAGDVGDKFQIFQGIDAFSANPIGSGIALFSQYAAATPTFGTATDFFDSLAYTALQPGTVILSPVIDPQGSSYWMNTKAGSATVASGYHISTFTNPGDTIGTLPNLVINVTAAPPIHTLISLHSAAAIGTPVDYGSSQGTLTEIGEHGVYGVAQATGFNTPTGYVEAKGFNPGTDEEIYAMDVLVNGTQANASQIALLVNAINNGDSAIPASPHILAADTYADLGVTHDLSPFTSQYNLFLDSASGPSSDNFFAWDLSSADDSNLVGYSVSAVAVVPEPMTFGLIMLGAATLLIQRPRHCKRTP